ncbi:carboxypeptidase-like regulatory domain-containing protein [Engelhardtia mirabilis]|uniref:Carboxypeptidase regulatory-like domain-containing protein n=1 Tax=Engelhardtia mirabilis TaxID=2528011 RepID=A0A518BF11_9BACT|nr:hypothetical protein Pla133_06210 [Planctomycetes bacterium Pla133]QDU99881.1 hypothetical protein Pla86_06200 [Planctomycetes bacterium Pla86]
MVQGYVNGLDGPVPNILVSADQGQRLRADESDEDGFYSISLPFDGLVTIQARGGEDLWPPPKEIEVHGTTPHSIDALRGTRTIRGVVADPEGRPVASAPVEAHYWGTRRDHDGTPYRVIGPSFRQTTSAADGTFVLESLPPMQLGAVAAPNSNRSGVDSLTSAPSHSVEVDLTEGDATGVRLEMTPAETCTVNLTLVGDLDRVGRVEVIFDEIIDRHGPNPFPMQRIEPLEASESDPRTFVWRVGPVVPPSATAVVRVHGAGHVTTPFVPIPNEVLDLTIHL